MKDIDIRLVGNREELEQVFRIREMVFVKEQNVQRERERDNFDTNSNHVLAMYRNKPIGCARIKIIDRRAKLERVAVLKNCRKRGVGALLMDYLVTYCKKNAVEEIFLHAQCEVSDFYKKWGFEPRGEPFMEEGIKHVEMYLKA